MSYIYCVRIHPDTQDDVNLKFREAGLKGELLGTMDGKYFVSPQLSHTLWSVYPQSSDPSAEIDAGWDEAIDGCVKLLKSNYGMPDPVDTPNWVEIQSFRCTKMESFLRELDVANSA